MDRYHWEQTCRSFQSAEGTLNLFTHLSPFVLLRQSVPEVNMTCEVFLKSRVKWTSVVDDLSHVPWQEIRQSLNPGSDLDEYFQDLISHHVPK